MVTTPREGEYMNELVKFITRSIPKGYTSTQIRVILEKQQGYTRAAIDRAFRLYDQQKAKEAKNVKEEPKQARVQVVEPKKKKSFFSWIFGK